MTEALKPCPFCGAAMEVAHGSMVHPLVATREESCILAGLAFSVNHSRWGTDETKRWNRRATHDEAAALAEHEEKGK